MTIVCLYAKLAGYFFKSIQHLLIRNPQIKVYIIRYEASPNAPFKFEEEDRLKIIGKSSFNDQKLISFVEKLDPRIIYVSGWSDKTYLRVCETFLQKKVPVVMGVDNIWTNTLRQRLGVIYFKRYLQRAVSHIWIAGMRQYEFARQLGFSDDKILKGVYCADVANFAKAGGNAMVRKKDSLARSIVFVGRLVPYKQPDMLARCFSELEAKAANWQLTFIGSGPLKHKIEDMNNPHIKVIDFMQPNELPEALANHTVFCLPSNGEHWGVVIQEAAAAGLSIIASNQCGAATEFIVPGYNGFLFNLMKEGHLKDVLQKVMSLSDERLLSMGENSMRIANKINHDIWMHTLLSLKY